MTALIPWHAVLAPLGVVSSTGHTLANRFRLILPPADQPVPFLLKGVGGNLLIGSVSKIRTSHGACSASGLVDPTKMITDDISVVDQIRSGALVPGMTVDRVTVEDGEVVSARVMDVIAQPFDVDAWNGMAWFLIDDQAVAR